MTVAPLHETENIPFSRSKLFDPAVNTGLLSPGRTMASKGVHAESELGICNCEAESCPTVFDVGKKGFRRIPAKIETSRN